MQAFGGVAGTRGESDKRGFCGLIRAIPAKSPAIIMVGNLFDLSGSFCMFPLLSDHVLFKTFAVYSLFGLSLPLQTK